MTALEANPTFQADLAVLTSVLPSSVIQEGEQDPEALVEQIFASSELPAWVSAIPTPVIESLESLIAKPINAVDDVENYVEQLVEDPEVASAVSVLMTAVPTSVQDAFESNPASFLENIITATALPTWVTDIPAPLQSDIGSIVNEALSIIDQDLEGGANATDAPSGFTPSGYAAATSTGGAVGYNGTNGGATASPAAFTGAAAPVKTVAAGMAALMAGVGFILHV